MADFFGFNPSTDFEHELHDDPGDGLDEDADDYDALNDETFGADSMGGDWEQDHEELAQITEQSRPHRDSCGSPPPPPPRAGEPAGGRPAAGEGYSRSRGEGYSLRDEDDLGLDNLELEASLAQLVDDGDDQHDAREDVGSRTSRQRTALTHQRVMEPGYSCSPPSEFNVWAVNRVDQARQHADMARQQQARAQALPPAVSVPKMPKVHTLEELERDLLGRPAPAFPAPRPAAPHLRLEDLERDLTAPAKQLAAKQPPPGFQTPPPPQPPQQHRAHFQHLQEAGGHPNGVPPHGYPPHAGGRGSAFLPPPPHMLDFRQHGRHMGPNMLRFMPPHPMMANQQYQQHRPHMGGFRHAYQMPPHGMDPRHYPPHLRPPYPRLRHPPPPPGHRPANGYHSPAGEYHHHSAEYHHHNAEYHHHDVDEYDGLMNEREVRWLLNIQMLQLNTSQPYRDDFYYTVYQSRKPKNRPSNRNGRERRDSYRDNWPDSQQSPRVYTPLQFENSLGKLQCGSVTTPRKIIDMDVVSEPADAAQAQQKDSRRAKQLLLCLEQMYLLLMQVEDADNPLAEPAEVDSSALVAKIVTTLLAAEDRLQATLCVGKGKRCAKRLLAHPSTQYTSSVSY